MLIGAGGCLRVRVPEAQILPGAAQDDLTWQRAVQLALAHHPDVRAARENLSSSVHARNAALGRYLPGVDGTVRSTRGRTTTSDTTDTLAFDLDIEQPLFAGGEITGEALQAWRTWQAARFAYQETSAEVRQRLREAYVELLRLDQLRDVNQAIARRRQDNAELIHLRYEAGRENRGSMLRAQAIADQAAFEVRQTERRVESQSLALGRHLGGHFFVPWQPAGDLEPLLPELPGPPGDYAQLAEQTPFVQRATREAEAFKAAVLSAQSTLWPTATGTANFGSSGTSTSDQEDDRSVGVTVSVPVFHGGQNVSGVFGARADYEAAAQAARSTRDARISVLAGAWQTFRDAREFVDVRRAFLEAARARAEIVREQYTSGLADFQDFDIAEQELADSEKAYVQSLADVLTQQAAWQAGLGSTLEEALHAP